MVRTNGVKLFASLREHEVMHLDSSAQPKMLENVQDKENTTSNMIVTSCKYDGEGIDSAI